MFETVTVNEAIAKGKRTVNAPAIIILIIAVPLISYLGYEQIIPFWAVAAGGLLSLLAAWLYWAIAITKWRIWAFENVRNVHELKKTAIREGLIHKDNSFMEKTEIRTVNDKNKLESLQYKFVQRDVFNDNISVPEQTEICYSKNKNLAEMAGMLVLVLFGIFLILIKNNFVWGPVAIIAGLCFAYKEYKEATNTTPQIIINNNGIKTVNTKFHGWQYISNEEVITKHHNKSSSNYLQYDHPGGSESIEIDDLETDKQTLNELLRIYRGRNEQTVQR